MNPPLYDREATAQFIRQFFIEHKRRMHPTGKYAKNDRHDHADNWLKAADACMKLGANPRDYIDAAFTYARQSSGPFANALAGPSAANWWHEYTRARAQNAVLGPDQDVLSGSMLRLEIEQDIAHAVTLIRQREAMPERWSPHATLSNPFTSIEPWPRVAIAGREGMWDVVAQFSAEARTFLAKHPGHVECLRALGFNLNDYLNAATTHA